MYIHQGGPLALQSSTQLNHGGVCVCVSNIANQLEVDHLNRIKFLQSLVCSLSQLKGFYQPSAGIRFKT